MFVLCHFVVFIMQVYEALVEEKGKNFIFMRLSAACVKDLQLKPDTNFPSEVSTAQSFLQFFVSCY